MDGDAQDVLSGRKVLGAKRPSVRTCTPIEGEPPSAALLSIDALRTIQPAFGGIASLPATRRPRSPILN